MANFSSKSIVFDGVNEYVSMGDVLGFERTQAFSISFWVKNGVGSAITKINDSTVGWMIDVYSNRLEVGLINTWVTNCIYVTLYNPNLGDGNWHHCVVTYDGSSTAAGVLAYFDGGSAVSALPGFYDTLTSSILNSAAFWLGGRSTTTNHNYFVGKLDEIAIYNRALTVTEVTWIYNSGGPRDLSFTIAPPNLIAWWRMGEWISAPWINPYPTIYDASGSGNVGTMTNMSQADIVTTTPGGVSTRSCNFAGAVDKTVRVATFPTWNYNTPFSVSFWFKVTDTGAGVSAWRRRNDTGSYVTIEFGGTDPASYIIYYVTYNYVGLSLVINDLTIRNNSWHHLVATYNGNGTGSGQRVYLDGNLIGVGYDADVLTSGSMSTMLEWVAYNLGGLMDEGSVYSKALSLAEVQWIYNAGAPNSLLDPGAPSNLTGWWKMGDDPAPITLLDSGPSAVPNTVRDLSGNNYTGTMSAMESTDVVFDAPGRGQCAAFNAAVGDIIQIASGGSVIAYDRFNKFSVSWWGWTAGGTVCSKVNAGYTGWWISYGSGSSINLILNYQYGTSTLAVNGAVTANLHDGRWHHFVITYDGSNSPSGIKMYIDGAEVTVYTTAYNNLTNSIIYSPSDTFVIGTVNSVNYFNGRMRDLALWGKELTAAQVAWVYNGGQPRELASVGSPEGLDGWWRLGNGDKFQEFYDSGPAVHSLYFHDNSFNNYMGQWYNMEASDIVYDAPGRGKSVLFDGVNEYVTMGDVLGFERTNSFSISQWVKFTSTSGCHLVAKITDGTAYRGYGTGVAGTTGYAEFVLINDYGVNNRIAVQGQSALNDGLWHHVLWTYDGSSTAAGCKLYVDGVAASTTAVVDNLTATIVNTTALALGARAGGPGWFYTGSLDEAAIYDKELSAGEVTWIYNAGVPRLLTDSGCPSNLQAWWKMGDGDTFPTLKDHGPNWVNPFPTILDASGMGYHGTMTNMEIGDVTTNTPGGVSGYSCTFNQTPSYDEEVITTAAWGHYSQDPFSVCAWVKATSAGTYFRQTSGWPKSVGMYVQGSGSNCYVTFDIAVDGAPSITTGTAASFTLLDGNWHFIVGTYTGSRVGSGMRIYIDGALAATGYDAFTLTNGILIDGVVHLGGYGGLVAWLGSIDEVSMYSRALNLTEVQWIYNSGAPKMLNAVGAPTGLVGWWRMGDDSLGYKGTMTLMEATDIVNCSPGGGFAQKSLLFDGVNEYITPGNVLAFEYTSRFSVSCWFKSKETGPGWFVAKMSNTGPSRGWGVGFNDGAGAIKFELTNAWSSNVNFVHTTTAGFNDGQWHHCVATWDGNATPGAGGMRIYIDGINQTLTTVYGSLSATIVTAAYLYLGSRESDFPGQCYAGNLVEVAIYSKTLTATEVAWIYNSGVPRDLKNIPGAPLNLVGWWRLGGSAYRSSSATGTWQTRILGDSPGLTSDFATKCLSFDGFAEHINFGNILAFERNQAFSLTCWARWASDDYGALIAKEDGFYVGYNLYKYTGGGFSAELQGTGGGYINRYSNVAGIGNGRWHHIAMTYDGSSTRAGLKLWLDGVDVTGTGGTDTLTTSIVTTTPLRVGMRTTDLSLTGNVDEVAIYNKQLIQSELEWIYNAGIPRDLRQTGAPSNLQGWWRMGEGAYPGSMINMEAGDIIDDIPGLGVYPASYFGLPGITNSPNLGFRYHSASAFALPSIVNSPSLGFYLLSAESTSSTTVDVAFSNDLDVGQPDLTDPASYTILYDVSILGVSIVDSKTIRLVTTLINPSPSGSKLYTVIIVGDIKDINGNSPINTTTTFWRFGTDKLLGEISVSQFSGEPTSGILSRVAGAVFFSPSLFDYVPNNEIDLDNIGVIANPSETYRIPVQENKRIFTWGPNSSARTNMSLYVTTPRYYTVVGTMIQTIPPGPTTIFKIL